MAGSPLLRVPWPNLLDPEPAAASEFGWGYGLTPPELEDAEPKEGGRYCGTRASDSLPYALEEGNAHG